MALDFLQPQQNQPNLNFGGGGPWQGAIGGNLPMQTGSPLAPTGGVMSPAVSAGGGGGDMWQSFMDNLLTTTDKKSGQTTQGIGDLGLGVAQAGLGAWQGMRQLDLAEETFDFQKEAFNKNFAMQQQTTNRQLQDRQRARVASNPEAYQSVKNYMAENRV